MTLEEVTKEMTIDEAIKDLEKIKKVKFSPISQPVSMDMAIEALKATRWIPVSEQLPEPSKRSCLHEAEDGNNIRADRNIHWYCLWMVYRRSKQERSRMDALARAV